MAKERSALRGAILHGSTLGLGVVLVAALLGIFNYFGWKYHRRFDWTSTRLYSLSEKTLNVLGGLDKKIDIVVFMDPNDQVYPAVRELLSRYEAESPQIRVRVVDPAKNRAEAERLVADYEITHADVVVFDGGDDRRVVEGPDLAEYDYSAMAMGGQPTVKGFKGEQLFTSAVIELVESRKPKILFTTGHGEASLDDFSERGLKDARELLGEDNFDLEEWASLGKSGVPLDADLVVIAGPTAGFVEPELAAFREHLDRGGRMLVLLDPTLSPVGGLVRTGLEPLLADYGVKVADDIVIDPANPLPFFGAETIFVNDFEDHAITRSLRQANLPVILPLARSVSRAGGVEGYDVIELLRTTEEGWGEADLAALPRVKKDDTDAQGPVPIGVAVAAEGRGADRRGPSPEDLSVHGGDAEASQPATGVEDDPSQNIRLVVFGDSDFATNGQLRNVGNPTLLANTMNWLVERESLVGIPPKTPEQVRLNLTQAQLRAVFWTVIAGMPLAAVLAGGLVYLRRRR